MASVEEKPMVAPEAEPDHDAKKRPTWMGTLARFGVPTALAGGYYFLLQPEWIGTVGIFIVSLIASFFKFFWGFIQKVFKRVGEQIEERWVEATADWIVGKIERGLWFLASNYKGKYYRHLIYKYRTYRTEGLKTKGPFTLDLEKVFVPLHITPEAVSRIPADMVPKGRAHKKSLQIWDFLANTDQPAYRSVAIIAAPGAGKTTLLEHLTLIYAKNAQRRFHPRAPKLIPLLFYLRDIRDIITSDNPPNLDDLFTQQIQQLSTDASNPLTPPKGWFDKKLRGKKCLVMLDGLDEVADEAQRKKVSTWADAQMARYPEARFILTSRPFGYRSAPVERVGATLEVQSFSLKEVEQFIRNWYLQNEALRQARKEDEGVRARARKQATDLIASIKNSPPLAAMALNPLMLTMIATVHDNRGALPGRRVELYAEICDVLLGRRQEAKGLEVILTPAQKQSVLQVLALALMQKRVRSFGMAEGSALIQNQLQRVPGADLGPESFLKHIRDVSGLLVERERDTFEFAHLSFQEYLAAAEIQTTHQASLLNEHIVDAWWAETIRLYAAQSDTTELIRAALKNQTLVSMTLAYDCLEEGLSADPEVQQQLVDTFEKGLESDNADLARFAAEVKLARRIKRLLRMDDDTEIDMGYVSCAEYQLFLDDTREAGQVFKPDHWPENRFAAGMANKPVTGVMPEEAAAFCQWLTLGVSHDTLSAPPEGACAGQTRDGKQREWSTKDPDGPDS